MWHSGWRPTTLLPSGNTNVRSFHTEPEPGALTRLTPPRTVLFDRISGKRITDAMHGSDVTRLTRIIVQRPANLPDKDI